MLEMDSSRVDSLESMHLGWLAGLLQDQHTWAGERDCFQKDDAG